MGRNRGYSEFNASRKEVLWKQHSKRIYHLGPKRAPQVSSQPLARLWSSVVFNFTIHQFVIEERCNLERFSYCFRGWWFRKRITTIRDLQFRKHPRISIVSQRANRVV